MEDDTGIGAMIRRGLEGANFQVEWAIDGATGLRLAGETAYSVIILDVMLPKSHQKRTLAVPINRNRNS